MQTAIVPSILKHHVSVFKRLTVMVIHPTKRHTAFCRKVDKLYSNGSLLGQIEFMAKFEPVMKEHVRCFTNNRNIHHYLNTE
jgi:hypothetical protein